jgi:serine/threonine-protein kinase
MDLKPGVVVGERYRIERVIATDEGGTLLATREAQNGFLVAVKVLPSTVSATKLINRFSRAKDIDSPHFPKLFELGGIEDGRTFVAMEYLQCTPLSARIARHPLAMDEAIAIVLQACHALAAAHREGVVHRRVQTAKLVEAKTTAGRTEIKLLGLLTGMPGGEVANGDVPEGVDYLAPEQLAAINDGDRAADIWALGVILYELLTGKMPFSGLTRKAVAKHVLSDDPKPPRVLRPELPWQLEQTILRCLDKSPTTRMESVDAVVEAVTSFAAPSDPSVVQRTLVSASLERAPVRSKTPPPDDSPSSPRLPDVTKLHHLQPEVGPKSESTPAFHRLRPDGQIEGIKADEVVVMARARRVAEEAARLKSHAGPLPSAPPSARSASVPPRSASSVRPPASVRPSARPSAAPKAGHSTAPSHHVTTWTTSRIVTALIVAAVAVGLGIGLLVRLLLP